LKYNSVSFGRNLPVNGSRYARNDYQKRINAYSQKSTGILSDPARFYSAAYYKALPFIVELRTQGDNRNLSELENCFEALYGLLLLKLQKRDISEGTLQATKTISQLLGILSDYYKKDKAGELELD
jgi:hypothetical protein